MKMVRAREGTRAQASERQRMVCERGEGNRMMTEERGSVPAVSVCDVIMCFMIL